jgi:hypothetical protein
MRTFCINSIINYDNRKLSYEYSKLLNDMAKWLAMWIGSIIVFVAFIIVTQVLLLGDREFQSSGDEGFKLLYPNDLSSKWTSFHY